MVNKKEISFEIIEHIGILSESSKGWTLEANIISWNGAQPKLDIRSWDKEKTRSGKGITLDKIAVENLVAVLAEQDIAAKL